MNRADFNCFSWAPCHVVQSLIWNISLTNRTKLCPTWFSKWGMFVFFCRCVWLDFITLKKIKVTTQNSIAFSLIILMYFMVLLQDPPRWINLFNSTETNIAEEQIRRWHQHLIYILHLHWVLYRVYTQLKIQKAEHVTEKSRLLKYFIWNSFKLFTWTLFQFSPDSGANPWFERLWVVIRYTLII